MPKTKWKTQLIKPLKTPTKGNAANALPEDNELPEDNLNCEVKLIFQKIT